MRRDVLTPLPPVIIVHDERSFLGLPPESAKERRRRRDREHKRERYHNDPAYRARKIAREHARYERDKERIKARFLVENMTPEQVLAQRERERKRRKRKSVRQERIAYLRAYRQRPEVKASRRAKALLRAALDLVQPRASIRGARVAAECPRAVLFAVRGAIVAVPSARSACI